MASIDLEYNSGFQIYNSDGTPFHDLVLHKCTYETVVMSLGDKISGILYYKDNALDVTMSEYIIYKGVRYTLVNPPTILREGLVSDNSELRGMTKYSFTFYHPMYVLNNFPFSDIAVQSGQSRYLSQNKTFSWIGTLVDFVAKLNKNLEDTQWMVTIGNVTQEEQTKLSEVLSFDKNTIAEALKRGYETWEVPYVVDQLTTSSPYYPEKRFVVQYGLPTTEILDEYNQPFVFQMGQGVGLKNNSRNPKNNKIITRIAGYGSEDNIPYGYPQIPYYGGNVEYPLYYGIVGGQRVQLIKHPFTRNHLMPSVYSQSVYNKVNPKLPNGNNNPNYDPTIELVDYYDANDNTYTNRIKPNSPSYEIHEFGDIKPELGEKSIISAVPVSQQETQPDYKQKSDFLQEILDRISATEIEDEKTELLDVYDRVDAGLSYYEKHGEEGGDTYWYVFSITRDDYYEYVSYESGNYNFTATMLRDGSLAPTPDWDDTMDDDGNYLQSYFKITLPTLEFDLYACAAITQEMKINMRSGACIGCTFPVEVDWDDYKRNFYNSDGEFDPDGEQRDYTKYPDSSNGQITVMVKKELETFGTLMPNQYQQPTTGDKFVILGISLPNTYITSAEQRLDTDMKQYMRDNNVYYYDYPLKFDEHFLISHEDILSQMKNNVVVRFNYAGTEHALYIKQMSVKYNESPLPKYDITLTDDIEIVLNQIGQVTDEVSKLRLGFGAGGFGTVGAEYIRKDIDDTARGTIRMIKGMQVGERFVTGLLGEGGVFRKDSDGTTYLETDKLYVRMKAYFDTVEVKHYLHTGGNRIASQASGIVCSRVEMIDAHNNLAMDVADAVLFRCFFKANDGDKTIRNDFMIGDLAFCRETNVDVSSVNLHGYWRLVIGRNVDGFLTENKEAWIDLSNRASDSVVVGGVEYSCAGYQNGSDAPIAQDDIIQLGNIADKDRQGAIVEYVGGEDAPSYQIFQGIGEDLPYPYILENKNYIGLGYSSQTGHAYMNVYGDVFIGAKPDAVTGESPTYIKYDSVDKKLTIKAIIDGSSPIGDTDTTIEQALADLLDDITDLQSQIDGSIETFFNDYMPVAKTQEGAPANRVPLVTITIDGRTVPCEPYYSWYTADHGGTASEVNTERLKHLGDIFYDNTSGYAFRFSQNESTHVFEWVEITDSAVIKALRDAAEAYGLADTKNKIFTTVAGQLPPYPWKEGDLWVNATYPADGSIYSNDILKCKQDRTSDGSITDWTLASKYTDDKKVERYTNILTGSVQPSESSEKEIALAAENAIRTALGGNFILDGGLMLMSIIGMRKLNQGGDPSDPDDYTTWAGISGVYDDNLYGGGIAAWYGGGLVDKRNPTTGEYDVANGAKSGFRFDGSGWLADGNINWNAQGAMVIKNIETIYGTGNDSISINELSALTSIFHTETYGSGNITELLIKPQNAYSQLFINRSGNPLPASSYPQDHTINEYSVLNYGEMKARFVPLEFFNALFTAYSDANHTNAINPWAWTDTAAASRAAINNLKILVGAWTEQYLSALGHNSQQSGGGGIGDVTWEALAGAGNQQINISHLSSAGVATQSWVRSQLGSSVVRVDVGTDQYFPSGGVVSLPAYPTTLPASDVSAWAKADTKPEYSFSEITGSLTESDIPSLSWSKITTGKPTSWWGASSIDANGAVKGSMSNVGDIAFSASGKNIGGLLYFIISQTTPQIKVGSNATLVQYAYSNGTFTPKLYVDGYAGVNGEVFAKGLELVGSGTTGNIHGGYIDFHYNASTADFTTRIIERANGVISVTKSGSTASDITGLIVGNSRSGDYIQIGAIRIVYDNTDNKNALKVVGSNGSSAANFYATGAVSALGSNSQQGGGGVTLNQPLSAINSAGLSAPTVNGSVLVYSNNVWKYSNNAGIFATSLSVAGIASAAGFRATGKDNTYVLLAGGGTKLLSEIGGGGSVTGIVVGSGNPYTPTNGIVTLPAYVTISTAQTISGAKSFNNGCWILASNEYDEITSKHWAESTLYNNANTAPLTNLSAIYNAIRFRWYDSYWNIGNIRSDDTPTNGFGIALEDTTNNRLIDCLRVTKDGTYVQGNLVWHAGNVGAGSGLDADMVDGKHLSSWIYPTSPRDFANGTLITTNIDYSVTEGDSFYMEISGDTYTRIGSMLTLVQGYIYNNTIINYSVNNLGRTQIDELYAINVSGKLVFWFPRIAYWHSYKVGVYCSNTGNYWENRAISITNSTKPSGTKEINLCTNKYTNAYTDSNVASATYATTAGSTNQLNGHTSDYYVSYDNSTQGNDVDFNTLSNFSGKGFVIQPIHTPNYTGQTNYPYYGYGTMVCIGGNGTQFPFRFALYQQENDEPVKIYVQNSAYSTSNFVGRKWSRILTDDMSFTSPSASKLQTKRTLWGQEFDGTANVSGDIYLGINTSASIGCSYNQSDQTRYNRITFSYANNDGDLMYIGGSWTGNEHNVHVFQTNNYTNALVIQNGGSVTLGRGYLVLNGKNGVSYSTYIENQSHYGLRITANSKELLFLKHDGTVGIGTLSPSYKLHVDGTFYAGGGSSIGGNFSVTGTLNVGSSSSADLSFQRANANFINIPSGGSLWFYTTGVGTTAKIDSGGAVSITSNLSVGGTLGVTGATTLSSTLSVSGATTHTGSILYKKDASLKIYSVTGAATTKHEAVAIQSCIDDQDPETSSGIYVPSNLPSRCVIALQPRGGRVGIGTTSPSTSLHVVGDTTHKGTLYINNTGGSYVNSLRIQHTLERSVGTSVGITIGGRADNDWYYTRIASVMEGATPSYLNPALAFYTMYNTNEAGSEVERMRISSSGNVGIGTTSPSTSLHVIGRVTCEYDSTKSGSFYATRGDYTTYYGINSSGFAMITTAQKGASSSTVRISMTPYTATEQYIMFGMSSNFIMGTGISGSTSTYRDGAYIQIGGARIVWDSTNNALKVIKSDGTSAANFYATGAVSALGANTSSGGGGTLNQPLSAINTSGLSSPTVDGATLVWNSSKWVYSYQRSLLVHSLQTISGGIICYSTLDVNGVTTLKNTVTVNENIEMKRGKRIRFQQGASAVPEISIYTSSSDYNLHLIAASIYANSTIISSSDIRLKDVEQYIERDISSIAQAPIFYYRWKKNPELGLHLGSSAQYWSNVFKYAVMDSGEGYLGLDYSTTALAAAVITARKVQNHEDRILKLERENEQLRNEIKQLKAA